MKSKVLLMASLAMLGAAKLKAQLNVGAATAPTSMLYVNGPTATAPTSVTVSGNAATINVAALTGSGMVLLTGSATATVLLNGSGTPVAGQHITIHNTTTFAASFGSATILPGTALSIVFSNGAWQATSPAVTNLYNADGALTGARTVTQAANNLTFTGSGSIYKLSGAAGTVSSSGIGRTTSEFDMGVVASAGQAFGGTLAGDGWVRNLTGNMFIGTYAANDMVFYSSNAERMRLSSAGYMGIGTTTPYAPLQFANAVANRKMVLYDNGVNALNDSAFYGFGVNSGILRYQVPTGQAHSFYSNKTLLATISDGGGINSIGGASSGFYFTDRSRPTRSNALYANGGYISLYGAVVNNNLLNVDSIGGLSLPYYGHTAFTGTAVNYLAVDATGRVIEQTLNSGTAPNIYNVNGAISSARLVDMNGFTMGFKGTNGIFTFNSTGNTFSTSANGLQFQQTGDQLGESNMLLYSRAGLNGLLVTTGSLTTGSANINSGAVTDLVLQNQGGGTSNSTYKQMNLRTEGRTSTIFGHYGYSRDTTELQLGKTIGPSYIVGAIPEGPALVVGDKYVISRAAFGIGQQQNDSVRTALSITPAAVGAKITLYDGGVANTSNNLTDHYGFGITSGQLNYDVQPNAAHVFYISGKNGSGTERARINNTGLAVTGTITATGAITGSSDRRLKRNIVDVQDGLASVMKLQPVSYEKKAKLASTNYEYKEMGFIAQDIRKVFPELVLESADADKLLSVNYIALIPLLTKAIQEQQAEITALKALVESMRK